MFQIESISISGNWASLRKRVMSTSENGFSHKWEKRLTAFIPNLGVGMCVHTHVCMYVHMCMSAHAHTKPPLLLLSCLLLYDIISHWTRSSVFQLGFPTRERPRAVHHCCAILGLWTCSDTYVFTWVLGIWTQVFIPSHVLLPIS